MNDIIKKIDDEEIISIGKEVLQAEIDGISLMRQRLGRSFADAVNLLASCEGRVAITGLGKSGLVGRKIAATLSSTGTPAYFMHPVEGAHGDLGSILDKDVVVAISNSGKTAELLAIMSPLRQIGAKIIALVGNPRSPLADCADIFIDVSVAKEACSLNLAPTTSTTVTLAVGDALAVSLMKTKDFTDADFKRFHPGGALGQRLKMHAREIMNTEKLPIASEDSSLGEALAVLDRGNMGAVFILDGSRRLVGILTDGDVRKKMVHDGLNLLAPISSMMTQNPRVAKETDFAAELLDLMEQKAITVLPVVDDAHRLIGMLHIHDILGKGQFKFAG
ncbi:KpsF/GutQ family sugar-phosphate isomerase [Desulfovibrio litoralis]|uniref:Arabinose-5-phosphate isomerase n=1 Tax=Desulfovibrio litoralis DSM 11393 TaxID=1121455 RepID=A0A1M7T6P2_9BACT|nr:KpsF/GutQ family sugar-phosphate isomerase [Desulfovibrio litoralis]SHN66388.1 arabinose-5-phosphate isomerase [Desulfovibrio litoralis DSM 11393]